MRTVMRLLALLLACCMLPWAHAHKPSDSYLAVRTAGQKIEVQWDIALRDLEYAIGLDADGDGQITWGEVRSRRTDIESYALARLALRADGRPCPAVPRALLIDDHTDGAYAVLRIEAACTAPPLALDLEYRLLFDLDPQHKGLLRLEHAGTTSTAIFSPEQPVQRLALAGRSGVAQFAEYFREGVWHIWIGFDHILFLLALLLPAVLLRTERRWRPEPAFRPAFWNVVRVVTAFTVAHSITLGLATLGVLELPSRWVESIIAASVVLAALNNVFPLFAERRWLMAFVFGLIHGFGFASVLGDLGLPADALTIALVGFNIGVEAGQLAIVAVFLPLAWVLRRTVFYRRVVMVGGSLAIALLALAWLVERAADVSLLPF